MPLDNRELASVILIAAFLGLALRKKGGRSAAAAVVRAALRPKILLPLLIMLGYVAVEVWLAAGLRLWNWGMAKDTTVWVLTAGLVLMFNFLQAAREEGFFKNQLLDTIRLVAFLEFFIALYPLSLIWELILQLVLGFLTLTSLIAAHDPRHAPVKRVIDGLLALVGLGIAAFTVQQAVASWGTIAAKQLLLDLFLPVWLTAGFLPFVFLLSLYAVYEELFIVSRVPFAVKCGVVASLGGRLREAHEFSRRHRFRLARCRTFADARAAVAEFRSARAKEALAAAEKERRLRQYAGATGCDAEGRRLDCREFKETQDALQWIWSCHAGHHGNHGPGYWSDILGILAGSFSRYGLPSEPGMVMSVRDDGGAWYAWRRTVTGWCFAIGAAGPPPDQWLYDGPEPPGGFPGSHPDWGDAPLLERVIRNWN